MTSSKEQSLLFDETTGFEFISQTAAASNTLNYANTTQADQNGKTVARYGSR